MTTTPPQPDPAASQCNGPSSAPLSPEHREQFAQAQLRRKKINRAQKIAAFNAWCFTVFAVFSLLFAFFSLTSLIAGIALAGLAYNEFRGRRQLALLNPAGPQTLGINQVICCLLIALYCGVQLYRTITGPGAYAQAVEQNPELADMLAPMADLIQTATIATYGLVFIIGVAAQGLTAWYYFSRKRHLDDYLEQTPDWVLDLERAGSVR